MNTDIADLRKIGEKKYTVLVNNKRLKEIDGIDKLFYNSCFFSAHQLLFYGLKGNGDARLTGITLENPSDRL